MAVQLPLTDQTTQMKLQEGFRFSPTDNKLLNYLYRKIAGVEYGVKIIEDIELYKVDQWNLPSKALFGEKEWYFFCRRYRKYQNGTRPNRMTNSGYWKATGTDKDIVSWNRKRGVKTAMVFYTDNSPTGEKSDWIMHEYRLTEHLAVDNNSSMVDDWVLCRIYQKKASEKMTRDEEYGVHNGTVNGRDGRCNHWTVTVKAYEIDGAVEQRIRTVACFLKIDGEETRVPIV
ncbi:NAC domain-containing protein 72-like [Bidens hawaiensis]|uniref:NAC domain-containing protein 72-like n=1 Tax=Bidens hawaiensis TaxID=980011 RepID=UPI00404B9E43